MSDQTDPNFEATAEMGEQLLRETLFKVGDGPKVVIYSQLHPDDGGGPLVIPDPATSGEVQDGSHKTRMALFLGHNMFDCMKAGLLVLAGGARGAAGLTESEARQRLHNFVSAIDELEEAAIRDRDPLAEDGPDIDFVRWSRNIVAVQGAEIVELLTGSVDYRRRALEAEDELESAYSQLGGFQDVLRQLCGPQARSVSDLRHLVEGLQGSVVAADQRGREQAAFAVDLLEHLGRFPTSEMNEGLENIHYSICCSPRTAASEAVSHAYLDEAVEERYGRAARELSRRFESALASAQDRATACGELLEEANARLSLLATVHLKDAMVLENRANRAFRIGLVIGAVLASTIVYFAGKFFG